MTQPRRLTVAGIACALLLLLTGCGRVAASSDLPTQTVSAEASSASSSVLPEEDPYEGSPFRILGLTLETEAAAGNPNGDVTLLGRLTSDAETEEGYFTLSQLYDLSDGTLAALYSLSDCVINISEGDVWDMANVQEYLAVYDLASGQVTRTVALPEAEEINFSYVEQCGSLLWSWTQHPDGALSALCYDSGLNQVAELECDSEMLGCVTQDGSAFYYVEDGALMRQAVDGGDASAVALQKHFSVSYLDGLYTGADGAQRAILYGMAGDLQYYEAVVNLDTGEFLYLREDDLATLYTDGDTLIARTETEAGGTAYTVLTGDTPVTYTWDQEDALSLEVLSDGRLLFYTVAWSEEGSTTVRLGLYDEACQPIASTGFTVEESYVWLTGAPILLPEEDALLIPVQGDSLDVSFYRWDYAAGSGGLEGLTVRDAVTLEQPVADIEDSWDPAYFQPQDCPAELSDLREQADALEEQYGLTIRISDECRSFLGSYAITALSDHDTVAQALAVLEEELAKYPEGFFRQFECQWMEGIELYLAGTIIGIGDGVLDYAGGLQTTDDSCAVLAVDCSWPEDLRTALHHEISHAIELRLLLGDTGGVDEETWNALNPSSQQFGDCYTYTYEQFGYEAFYPYVYDLTTSTDVYFIDAYSLTFPTEDRARLFENVMNGSGAVDWASCPNLRAKLNYYAQCIRAGFDTTGWEDVPWEVWLEEDAAGDDGEPDALEDTSEAAALDGAARTHRRSRAGAFFLCKK